MTFLLKHWKLIGGGVLALAFVVWHAGQVRDHGEARYLDGQETERAEWQAKADAQQLVVDTLVSRIATLTQAYADDVAAIDARLADEQRAAAQGFQAVQLELATLQGEINAQPILDTPGSDQLVPAGRVQLHARADAGLARNRRDARSAAGADQADTAPAADTGPPAMAGRLDAGGGLTLATAEARALHLAAALAATEARYIALWEWAQRVYAADLVRWEAEQVVRAGVGEVAG